MWRLPRIADARGGIVTYLEPSSSWAHRKADLGLRMATTATATGARLSRPAGVSDGRTSHRTRLLAALEAADALPATAGARTRFLERASEERPAPVALASIAESDPGLAARIMRIAARYGTSRRGHVASVPEAIALLGSDGVTTVARGVTTYAPARCSDHWEDEVDAFRVHALAVRATAIGLAQELGSAHPRRVSTIALFHDIGKLVLARVHRGYPDPIVPTTASAERTLAERRALGVDHGMIGGLVARRWGLAPAVSRAIEGLHTSDADGDAAIVRLADLLVQHAHGRRGPLEALATAARRAGLADDALAARLEQPATAAAAGDLVEPCPLSTRQLEGVRGLAQGKSYKQIALELGISPSTVRTHLHQAYTRLGVADRTQAVLVANERGWIACTRIAAVAA